MVTRCAALPLLGSLVVLSGCFDYERIELTLAANARRGRVAITARAVGLHHAAADGCSSVADCRARLLDGICSDLPDDAASVTDWSSAVEVQADGTLDQVNRWEQGLDEGILSPSEQGILGVSVLRAGRAVRPRPTFAFLDDTLGFEVEVQRGRFEVLTLDLGKAEPAHLLVMRSRRGTLHLSGAVQERPSSPAKLEWAATIPGLLETLTEEPVVCPMALAQQRAAASGG